MAHFSQPDESIDTIAAVFKAAPGTELLYDGDGENGVLSRHLESLQHVKKGDSHILLVPQPSVTDPNDPLLWSSVKKWITLFNALSYSFLGAVTGPIMAAGMVQLSEAFHVPFQKLTYANGATLVCQGVATTIWITKSYAPLLVGRAFLGIFEAPIESIAPSTVTDIFFLHDRGEKISMYGLSVLGGNELGPMLSAFIIQSLGMNWAFYIVAMFIGLNLVTIFFGMPETKFTGERPSILIPRNEMADKSQSLHVEVAENRRKRSYVSELAFWGSSDPNVKLGKVFLRPFVLLAYPTVLWACVIYGMALSWNVILGATTAQLFAPPPYLFDSSAQGLVFLSPFIGSLVGTYLCGPLADRIANYYTKRNHGIREPEMRLPTCVIAAVLTFLGALMTGLCYQHQTHWAGPVVGFGVLSAGAQMGATLGMSYALDCHKELSVELMVSVASMKSLIAWIWTWVTNDWVVRDGVLTVLCVVAAVNTVAYLSTFLFYIKGKAIRLWIHDQDMLGKLGL